MHSTLPTKRESSSVRRALADRLLLSDAIDAVGKMIRGYANSGSAGKSYVGAIAELLMHYPRSVALRCADPFRGVARETKFMPTPADVIAFCERTVAPMHEEAAREERVAEQLQERAEWENSTTPDELKELGRAWLERRDPIAEALICGTQASFQTRRAAALERIETANKTTFERECRHAGVDPGRGVSPTLLKTIGGA